MKFRVLAHITILSILWFPSVHLMASDEADHWTVRGMKSAMDLMISDLGDKLIVYIPAIDTNPNRGLKVGMMPVILLKDSETEGIKQLHAPSLTYNRYFKWSATWRYYYYPDATSQLFLRGSWSEETNRDITADYFCSEFMDVDCHIDTRFQYRVDGSKRFYGFGPRSKEENESNYTLDSVKGRFKMGSYLADDVRADYGFIIQSDRIENGPVNSIVDIDNRFPGLTFNSRKMTTELLLSLQYDSRDSIKLTENGILFSGHIAMADDAWGSDVDYEKFGTDIRVFIPHGDSKRFVTAGRILFEQMHGDNIPFYLQQQLGGKETLRGFGAGRFTDKGRIVASIEERIRIFKTVLKDVRTEFGIDPFFEMGTVFARPGKMESKELQSVVGFAIRAVVKPHLVGSIDLGLGEEGNATFVSIDYSF